MCLQPPVELVKFCYEAFHYMLVWRSYYAVWAPAHVRRLLDSCHTSNMFHFLETLPPPSSLSLSLLTGTPHLSALLSVANTFLLQNELDDHFYPGGLAL